MTPRPGAGGAGHDLTTSPPGAGGAGHDLTTSPPGAESAGQGLTTSPPGVRDTGHDLTPCYDSTMNSTKQRIAYHIATVLGLGDKLPAPGTTAGSLPAIIGWWMAMLFLPTASARLAATLVGSVVVLAVGVWASQTESDRRGKGDPGPVVIDEVAGQWLTMVPALLLIESQTSASLALAAVAGFFLFRLFDVWKPWPVKRFEALHGGIGIMADDVAAAVYAAAVLALALFLL